jgi:hydroxymethylbilane synthase
MKKILRLGSRGSPLALLQAEEVRKKIFTAHEGLAREFEIEIVPIRTVGDWRPGAKETSFRDNGGNKELFTKEIEEALQNSHIDMAVHSMKDVASWLPVGLEITAMLDRVDPREAFVGRVARTLDELPSGATVGTSSVRRQAQLLARRPDLKIVPLRGNVETRLKKLEDGQADATLLAMAGLIRLGLQDRATSILATDVMLPAAAQGAIGIEVRSGDEDIKKLLLPVNCKKTFTCVSAERALLQELDGSCATPIGALANFTSADELSLEVMVARPDGSSVERMTAAGSAKEAAKLGRDLGAKMKSRLPPDFFTA